jgi:hypothetical protein
MAYPERSLPDHTFVHFPTLADPHLRSGDVSVQLEPEDAVHRKYIAFCAKTSPDCSQIRLPNFIEIL